MYHHVKLKQLEKLIFVEILENGSIHSKIETQNHSKCNYFDIRNLVVTEKENYMQPAMFQVRFLAYYETI